MKLQSLYQKIDYEFQDERILKAALTQRSVKGKNNERLEFLGDSIVNFIIGEELYIRYPNAKEGDLSRLRSILVRGDTLAELAREIGLGAYLYLGSGELKSGGRERDSILADALEATIAAVYLDAGMDLCRAKILSWYDKRLEDIINTNNIKDPKTRLQELLQGKGIGLPQYKIVLIEGQAHEQTFVIECSVEPLENKTQGRGTSRRRAEQHAAKLMLIELQSENYE